MDRGTLEYLRDLADDVTNEAECWCVLNGEDIENLDEETFNQCVVDVAVTLDLVEEDVEIILKDYLE